MADEEAVTDDLEGVVLISNEVARELFELRSGVTSLMTQLVSAKGNVRAIREDLEQQQAELVALLGEAAGGQVRLFTSPPPDEEQ